MRNPHTTGDAFIDAVLTGKDYDNLSYAAVSLRDTDWWTSLPTHTTFRGCHNSEYLEYAECNEVFGEFNAR